PDDGGGTSGGGGSKKPKTEPLSLDSWATLEGQILYQGDLPANSPASVTKDQNVCLCDDALKRHQDKDLVWLGDKVGTDTALENVVVFLRAPAGKHFKIEGTKYEKVGQDKELGTKVMDQPFCAYEPRVVVLYPAYSTGDDTRESGQRFIVKNSATILHNTKIMGNPEFNSVKSPTIPPKSEEIIKKLVPQPEPFKVTCDVHPW